MDNSNYSSSYLNYQINYRNKIIGSQNRHLHNKAEILFILSGSRSMFIESETFHMSSGDMIIIPPNVFHKSFNNLSGSEIFYIYTELTDFYLDKITCKKVHGERYTKILEQIQYEESSKTIMFEHKIKNLIDELLIDYIRSVTLSSTVTNNLHHTNNRVIQEIISYLNSHISEDLKLSNIATRFNLSEEHLSRLFPKETGFNYIEYISSLRVKEAQRLLELKHNSLQEIATLSGFGSYNQFGRVFKQLTNLTPGRYRKNFR